MKRILLGLFLLAAFPSWGNAACSPLTAENADRLFTEDGRRLVLEGSACVTATFMEAGTDATQGFEFWAATTTDGNGAITSDNAVFRNGPRSIKTDTGTPGAGQANATSPAGIVSDAGARTSFGFRAASFSTLGKGTFYRLEAGGTDLFVLGQISGGALTLYDDAANVLATGSTLSAATWYRMTVSYTITDTTHNQFRVYLDNATSPALTATNVTISGTGSDRFKLGNAEGTISTSIVYNFDDVYADNGATLDNISTNDLFVTAKLPATENTTNFDTAVGNARSASDYNNVNERPLSETNGWEHAAATDAQENYGLQTAATGDMDLTGKTILARSAWVWAKRGAGNLGLPKIMDNGSEWNLGLSTSSALYTHLYDGSAYPSNAAGIGMRSNSDTADTFFYEGGTLIAYENAPAATCPKTFALLHVGC